MPAPTIPPAHIALLDDHALFRQGMSYILRALPFVESVVEAADLPTLAAALPAAPARRAAARFADA